MNLTHLPQLARNAQRVREIGTLLSKYGLAAALHRLGLTLGGKLLRSPQGDALAALPAEARIRLALGELGPAFIKLGQTLSTRADLVGPALAGELAALQAAAPADPFDRVRLTVEEELKQPLERAYAEFDPVPVASASIGQVHAATLPDGRRVVVKVQHAGVEATVRTDLDILSGVADLAEQYLPEFRPYRPRATVAEFQRAVLRELDFRRERRNLEEFIAHFAGNGRVKFPRPEPGLCTARVLTMERLDGVKLSQAAGLDIDHEAFARRGAEVFVEMIFRDGFYHADPHPGNLLVLPGNVLGVIDCGQVGRLDEDLREAMEDVLLAVVRRDGPGLTAVLTRLGTLPPDFDRAGLRADVEDYLAYYASQPLDRLDLGGALNELIDVVRRHRVLLPGPLALLLKVLVMLEGSGRLLSPSFNLTELIVPYQEQAVRRWLSPRRQAARLRRAWLEWRGLGEQLPRGLLTLLQKAQAGGLEVRLAHLGVEEAADRIVLALLASASVLGASVLWGLKAPPLYGDVSVPGVVLAAAAAGLAARLAWAVRSLHRPGGRGGD